MTLEGTVEPWSLSLFFGSLAMRCVVVLHYTFFMVYNIKTVRQNKNFCFSSKVNFRLARPCLKNKQSKSKLNQNKTEIKIFSLQANHLKEIAIVIKR